MFLCKSHFCWHTCIYGIALNTSLKFSAPVKHFYYSFHSFSAERKFHNGHCKILDILPCIYRRSEEWICPFILNNFSLPFTRCRSNYLKNTCSSVLFLDDRKNGLTLCAVCCLFLYVLDTIDKNFSRDYKNDVSVKYCWSLFCTFNLEIIFSSSFLKL